MFQGIGNRGGNRGGKDQFNWEDVRGDKYKDYYIGQSMKINTGNWWNRGIGILNVEKGRGDKTKEQLVSDSEISKVKQEEQQLMMEALGLRPKIRRESGRALEKHEFKDLCRRGTTQRDSTDTDRIGGLGFAPAARIRPDGIEVGAPMPKPRVREESKLVPAADLEAPGSPVEARSGEVENEREREKKHKKEKKDKKEKKHKKRKERQKG